MQWAPLQKQGNVHVHIRRQERAALNASRQQAFITITTYFESPVDPLHIDNSNAGWYHYL